jgi:Phosphodiester glycosidase
MTRTLALLLGIALASGCATTRARSARAATESAIAPIAVGYADSIASTRIAQGIVWHHLVRNAVPLRIDVLDVDLTSCLRMHAMKGGPTAVGRKTTSAMLDALPIDAQAVAAINADFFVFAPPGVPVGALVENGRVITGPIERPVLAFDARNQPYIGVLAVRTTISTAGASVEATAWNRPRAQHIGIVDAAWAQPLDTLIRSTARGLVPLDSTPGTARRYVLQALPTAHTGMALGDTLMLTGPGTAAIADGDTVTLQPRWSPNAPVNVVGGFPLLVRDSIVSATLDTDGAESFRGLNPRTVAGYSRNGQRLLLVVIDGRRPGFSVGTTTRETADVMRMLGAVHAINLDGGGSSVMVLRDPVTHQLRIANRPSDAAGERPVGNALGIHGSCVGGVPPWSGAAADRSR